MMFVLIYFCIVNDIDDDGKWQMAIHTLAIKYQSSVVVIVIYIHIYIHIHSTLAISQAPKKSGV